CEHRHRPLAQERLVLAGGEDPDRSLSCVPAARGDHVLGTEWVAVAFVAPHVAELDQGAERAAQRLAADVELALQLDEPRTAALREERERRRGPAVVKELDQGGG